MREIRTDADLQNCIYFQQKVEVWVQGAFDEECMIADYDYDVIKIVGGYYYLRQNVKLRVV
ncbi:hypothetical protein O9H85_21680 [Paenibacillus filicis]|uniref:Phage protein n=1 Tax=Paenibacillus gyeongsangnamensis TaxID=3388067 RepID=A0ABT4QDN4_9BACL|nr:hypothetical protein [Paenibacillus filicis]MCZ8514984.1 hypothetical protein [Paenibacillus filicis]